MAWIGYVLWENKITVLLILIIFILFYWWGYVRGEAKGMSEGYSKRMQEELEEKKNGSGKDPNTC